ncbi:Dynein light chain type 1 family protein [Brugia malayi]|uniref:Dynein light chain n=1 Tax=Brugia malayi TaxID=6279 RepID=A0A0K0JWJ5_BRUMA|nr:Dynein light chain type 1 family protein [Brugia malayi]CDP91676.1 Bm8648 [Brugia malayi]VIO93481.1 Dynein light chain type 1 family protein [Brugia malayi]
MFGKQRFSQLRRQSRRWHNAVTAKVFRSPEVTIRSTNLDEKLQEVVKEVVRKALGHCSTENEVASTIKKHFDELTGPCWNCIVGRNFGSHVECTLYVHLIYSRISIILYKID